MTAQGQVAPGAEEVGQARIVQEMAPAFSLPGFDFGVNDGTDVMEAADEDAFNAPEAAEEEMFVEDTHVEEPKGMDMDDTE